MKGITQPYLLQASIAIHCIDLSSALRYWATFPEKSARISKSKDEASQRKSDQATFQSRVFFMGIEVNGYDLPGKSSVNHALIFSDGTKVQKKLDLFPETRKTLFRGPTETGHINDRETQKYPKSKFRKPKIKGQDSNFLKLAQKDAFSTMALLNPKGKACMYKVSPIFYKQSCSKPS